MCLWRSALHSYCTSIPHLPSPSCQADVYVYLHKKLDENFVVIASLEEKVDALENENERLRSEHSSTLEAATSESDARIRALTAQVDSLSDELRALEEFRANRETIKVGLLCVCVCAVCVLVCVCGPACCLLALLAT